MTQRGAGWLLLAAVCGFVCLANGFADAVPYVCRCIEPDGISVPDLAKLRRHADSWWPSVIGRRTRTELIDGVLSLSGEHLSALSNSAAVVSCRPEEVSAIGRPLLGRWSRLPESALLVGLFMQVDVLDAVLSRRDSAVARRIRDSGSLFAIKVKKEERVFGDRRDTAFFLCVNLVQRIGMLQDALASGNAGLPIPSSRGVKNQKEGERYFVACLASLTERAKKIR